MFIFGKLNDASPRMGLPVDNEIIKFITRMKVAKMWRRFFSQAGYCTYFYFDRSYTCEQIMVQNTMSYFDYEIWNDIHTKTFISVARSYGKYMLF